MPAPSLHLAQQIGGKSCGAWVTDGLVREPRGGSWEGAAPRPTPHNAHEPHTSLATCYRMFCAVKQRRKSLHARRHADEPREGEPASFTPYFPLYTLTTHFHSLYFRLPGRLNGHIESRDLSVTKLKPNFRA